MKFFIRNAIFMAIISTAMTIECSLGLCEKWRIVVVPLFHADEPFEISLLRYLVRLITADCKWYYGYLDIRFLRNDLTDFEILNPSSYDLLMHETHSFKYILDNNFTVYSKVLLEAVNILENERSLKVHDDFGSYILVITNFDANETGEINYYSQLINYLHAKNIHLRTVRLEFDERNYTRTDLRKFFQRIQDKNIVIPRSQNVSSHIEKISFYETESLLDNIKPCHALSQFEKLEHARYAQHYKDEAWVRKNKKAALIGAILLVCSVLLAIGAVGFYLYETKVLAPQKEESLSTGDSKLLDVRVDPVNPKVVNFNGLKMIKGQNI